MVPERNGREPGEKGEVGREEEPGRRRKKDGRTRKKKGKNKVRVCQTPGTQDPGLGGEAGENGPIRDRSFSGQDCREGARGDAAGPRRDGERRVEACTLFAEQRVS